MSWHYLPFCIRTLHLSNLLPTNLKLPSNKFIFLALARCFALDRSVNKKQLKELDESMTRLNKSVARIEKLEKQQELSWLLNDLISALSALGYSTETIESLRNLIADNTDELVIKSRRTRYEKV